MRRTIVLLATMALTVLVASGVVLGAGIGSAGAQSSVVGPGESIQKAVNAADPGDTIVVRGVHREDVVIRKNGIKLRGEDAVIEAPTRDKADSPCSKVFGPEAICVFGDANLRTGKVNRPISDVSISGFTIRGFKQKANKPITTIMIDVFGARNTTIAGNHVMGNAAAGIGFSAEGLNNTIENNDLTDNEGEGVFVQRQRNTTIARNDVTNDVTGDPRGEVEGIDVKDSRNTKIVNNVVKEDYFIGIEADANSVNTTIAGNTSIGNWHTGISSFEATGTKMLSNTMRRNEEVGIFLGHAERANAKVVGNNISGSAWGILISDTHRGSFAGNTIHDNCAGMFFEAFESEPVGDFELKGNTVENNTRSCRGNPRSIIFEHISAPQSDSAFSGIGIALIGASGMEVTGNQISGNVPSGPTAVSGGVVVSTAPFGGGTTKPMNNSVIGNDFGRNKPDIFWDESGSGNRFVGNLCNSSVPSRLCN
jgi:parallel beta-helix repeat protein